MEVTGGMAIINEHNLLRAKKEQYTHSLHIRMGIVSDVVKKQSW